ncbi:hypothetical protein AAFC00_001366 [Neodothiora populina]|uniref:Uncharacterized protein n=1 Tax=Neodothiora populina TaxID=2781224 RepID=A0ABR3PP26_9PEZI
MSAAPEQKAWQSSRTTATARNNQSRSANISPNHHTGFSKPASPLPGGVWAERAERERQRNKANQGSPLAGSVKEGSSNARDASPKLNVGAGKAASPDPSQRQHTPYNGFNAGEVRRFLRSNMSGPSYTPAQADTSESNAIAGGKNQDQPTTAQSFFADLDAQIAALKTNKQ